MLFSFSINKFREYDLRSEYIRHIFKDVTEKRFSPFCTDLLCILAVFSAPCTDLLCILASSVLHDVLLCFDCQIDSSSLSTAQKLIVVKSFRGNADKQYHSLPSGYAVVTRTRSTIDDMLLSALRCASVIA